MTGKPGDFTPLTAAENDRRYRQRAAYVLPPIALNQATAGALDRLLDRTGRNRSDLIRHLIRCADREADPFG